MSVNGSEIEQQQLEQDAQSVSVTVEKQPQNNGMWKENLGRYLIDISKYVVTGVMITSIFKDLDDKVIVYFMSFAVALVALIVGLVLTNKKKGY